MAGDKGGKETTKTADIETKVVAVTSADLDISPQKVSKSVSWTLNFLSPMDLEQRKHNLLRSLCEETGADIIISPQFIFKKRILGGGKLILSGYPAKYRNFRNLSEEEIKSFITGSEFENGQVIFINK